jgi:hypothetical protein
MSSETAYKPSARHAGVSPLLPKPVAHESRGAFQPTLTPRQRAVEAGLDRLDVSERHERVRRIGSRRRERLDVEQSRA